MQTRSRSSRSTGVCPSMPVSAVQNAISPVCGLVRQRVGDLLQIEAAQVKHQTRIDPSYASVEGATRTVGGMTGWSWWRRGRPTDSTVPVGVAGLCPRSGIFVRLVEFGLNPTFAVLFLRSQNLP